MTTTPRSSTPDAFAQEETARRAADAFGRAVTDGEIEPYLELLDPDVDFESASATQGGTVRLRGHAEVRRYLEQTAREYAELRLVPQQLRELGAGRFLVLGHWCGRVRGGTPFGAPLAATLELQEGKVARLRGFMDEQQALEAARAG